MATRFPLILVACCVFVSSQTHATTWFIAADGSGDAPTIQAGVDIAAPGDTILVGPGVFESVDIDKRLVLTSVFGPMMTKITATGVAIRVDNATSATEIRGFTIEVPTFGPFLCTGPTSPEHRESSPPVTGILITQSACTIIGNVIRGGKEGVLASDSQVNLIQNEISNAGAGVQVENSHALITGNRIFDCGACIRSWLGGSVTVTNNHLGGGSTSPCTGIYIGAGTASVSGNTIEGTDVYAVECSGSAVIENNRILDGGGVYLYFGSPCSVRGNTLVGSYIAAEHTPVTIESNTILGFLQMTEGTAVRNIVAGSIDCFLPSVLLCNNATTYNGAAAGAAGTNGNFSADPQFCGLPGSTNFYLQADSPCAPGNHPDGADCGLIGAAPVGCSVVKTQTKSLGAIKSMYRNQ